MIDFLGCNFFEDVICLKVRVSVSKETSPEYSGRSSVVELLLDVGGRQAAPDPQHQRSLLARDREEQARRGQLVQEPLERQQAA